MGKSFMVGGVSIVLDISEEARWYYRGNNSAVKREFEPL